MGLAAFMVASGIFLVMAAVRNESVPSILADVIRGTKLSPLGDGGGAKIGDTLDSTNDPRTGTPFPPVVPGTTTIGGTIGGGVVGRSGRAP
jgi:hypothetical protein